MRFALWSSAVCAVLVPCLCNELMQSSCASDDTDDDRCEFIQSGVGVHKEVSQHKAHKGWPDIFGDITKVLSGSTDLKNDAKEFKDLVETFATNVTKVTKDLVDYVMSGAQTLPQVVQHVDAAGHTIWVDLKTVLDALGKVGQDFDATVAQPIFPSDTFKQYLDAAIAAIKTKGDSLQSTIDVQLGNLETTQICAKAHEKLQGLEAKFKNFTDAIHGMTADGMKEEIDALKKILPETAKNEIDKFLTQVTAGAEKFYTKVSEMRKEIYNAFGEAFKAGQCPNFANFVKSAAPLKTVGMATLIAVSAAVLTV